MSPSSDSCFMQHNAPRHKYQSGFLNPVDELTGHLTSLQQSTFGMWFKGLQSSTSKVQLMKWPLRVFAPSEPENIEPAALPGERPTRTVIGRTSFCLIRRSHFDCKGTEKQDFSCERRNNLFTENDELLSETDVSIYGHDADLSEGDSLSRLVIFAAQVFPFIPHI